MFFLPKRAKKSLAKIFKSSAGDSRMFVLQSAPSSKNISLDKI